MRLCLRRGLPTRERMEVADRTYGALESWPARPLSGYDGTVHSLAVATGVMLGCHADQPPVPRPPPARLRDALCYGLIWYKVELSPKYFSCSQPVSFPS